eukprot:TRINITY_DN4359_c0_g1_i1.p1 TRINITY_DN4359_c0_g1~~TRINITY_DN4359_c0_g1_i1.p1  ORF type:complete len:863 (+),score=119.93 TRINITY_DN4359_c0_g1_i1:245-2590(+)
MFQTTSKGDPRQYAKFYDKKPMKKGQIYVENDDEIVASMSRNNTLEECIERALRAKFTDHQVELITDPEFNSDLLLIEEKHKQKRTVMKMGVVYTRQGQSHAQQMFANGRGNDRIPKFSEFMNKMAKLENLTGWSGYRGDMREPGFFYYHLWRHNPKNPQDAVEVVFHVAPDLNAEETRRLVGNDIVYLFYLEENATFDPREIDTFGEVPQIFLVVQPVMDKYKLGFFTKKNIPPYLPNVPSQLVTFQEAQTFILTKLLNGLVQTNYCPPMNRLFFKPRTDTLEAVCNKHLTNKKNPNKVKKEEEVVQKHRKLNVDNVGKSPTTEAIFMPYAEDYDPINALVLLIVANFSYADTAEEVKSQAQEQLGFQPDNVHFFLNTSENVGGVIAYDDTKLILAFRGSPNMLRLKKELMDGKKTKFNPLNGTIGVRYAKPLSTIMDKLDLIISKKLTPNHQLFLCGHDVGGSLAIIFANILHLKGKRVSGVYAYGSPRVGDDVWSNSYPSELSKRTFTIGHLTDFITNMPPKDKLFISVGVMKEFSANPQIAEPHSVESYYFTLKGPHKQALEKCGKTGDRLLSGATSIREQINRRESRMYGVPPGSKPTLSPDSEAESARVLPVARVPLSPPTLLIHKANRTAAKPRTVESSRPGTPTGSTGTPATDQDISQLKDLVKKLLGHLKESQDISMGKKQGALNVCVSDIQKTVRDLTEKKTNCTLAKPLDDKLQELIFKSKKTFVCIDKISRSNEFPPSPNLKYEFETLKEEVVGCVKDIIMLTQPSKQE